MTAFFIFNISNYSWSWTAQVLGVPIPCTVEKSTLTLQLTLLYPQIQPTVNHAVLWDISIEKYLSISGPVFKPMLFKGQPYSFSSFYISCFTSFICCIIFYSSLEVIFLFNYMRILRRHLKVFVRLLHNVNFTRSKSVSWFLILFAVLAFDFFLVVEF